jgi:hypothetical protein
MKPTEVIDMVKDITAKELESLRSARSQHSEMTRQEFQQQFASLAVGYSDLTLAKFFQVQKPCIGRWREGVSAPHPIGRGPIIEALTKTCRGCNKRRLECFVECGAEIDPII